MGLDCAGLYKIQSKWFSMKNQIETDSEQWSNGAIHQSINQKASYVKLNKKFARVFNEVLQIRYAGSSKSLLCVASCT
jgi:hypothetical protein